MANMADLATRVLRRLGVATVAEADRPAQGAPVPAETIAREALQWLGVIANDEAPAQPDAAVAKERLLHLVDSLIAQGLVPWNVLSIPSAVAEDMARLTALHLAPAFGEAADPAQLDVIEARIRRISLLLTAPAVAEQAVMDVHAQLDARGKTRWSSFDVPDYAEASDVLMAANLVAPQFGLPVDPGADVRAMRDLAQVLALPSNGEPVRADCF